MAKTMASLQAFPSSLLPRAWSRAQIPFLFPFENLPRRLSRLSSWDFALHSFGVAHARFYNPAGVGWEGTP